MSDKRSLSALGEVATLERSRSPLAHSRPIVVVVDRLGPRWAANALVGALEARGARVARLVVSLRTRQGAERKDEHVRASADALPAALTIALASLATPHDVVVSEGPGAVALLDSRLAILASPGSVLSLPPDIRALRACFDLVLFAERSTVLDRIAAKLWPSE